MQRTGFEVLGSVGWSAVTLIALVVARPVVADPAPETHCSTRAGQALLARYQSYASEVLNSPHPAAIDAYLSPEFRWHDAPPGMPDGIEPMRNLLRDLRVAFPDRKVETRFALCADDLILVQQLLTGTNTGPLLGFPATGKSHQLLHTEIYRIVDGRITELWGEGVIPLVLLKTGWTLVWPGDAPTSGSPAAAAP